jgi:SWI/SNF-related matrix-associated actin-dependent regulator of chromatin subfamily A3
MRHFNHANIPYERIDGNTPLLQRQQILSNFSHKDGYPVLMMTTGTGAFGYVDGLWFCDQSDFSLLA